MTLVLRSMTAGAFCLSEKILTLAVEAKLNRGEDIQCFINQIVAYQDITDDFINKYMLYINLEELNRKITMYRESFVNVMAYLERYKNIKDKKTRKVENIL